MYACFIVLVSVLAGCGGGEEPSAPAAPAAPAADSSAAAREGTGAEAAADADRAAQGDASVAAAPARDDDAAKGGAPGPALADREDRPPADDELPTFKDAAVTLTLVLPETMTGQVDFITPSSGGQMPYDLLAAQRFHDTDRVVVQAPASVDGPLYAVVHRFVNGQPSYEPGGNLGVVVDPIDLSRGDQELVVVMDEGTRWMAELFKPGEGEDVPPPDPDKGKPPE